MRSDKGWKIPDNHTLRAAGDPDQELRRIEVKRMQQARLYRTKPRIGVNQEVARRRDVIVEAFFDGFTRNYEYYVGKIVTANMYGRLCKRYGLYSSANPVRAFKRGLNHALKLDNVASLHMVSGIPMGTLLVADVAHLHEVGVIRFMPPDYRCEVHPAYQTDGFFFYGGFLEVMFPLGNPGFEKFAKKIHKGFSEPAVVWPIAFSDDKEAHDEAPAPL